MKKIKRYVPELVHEKIQSLDFKNKEHLYIICDMISRISIYRKENRDYSNQFIDIPKYYFRDIICDSEYLSIAFQILKENKIIFCDDIFLKGSKSKGYKFNDHLISKLSTIELNNLILSKKIILNKNKRNSLVNDQYKIYKDHFISTFDLDSKSAIDYINQELEDKTTHLTPPYVGGILNQDYIKAINKYNSLYISIMAIEDDELFFRHNISNGRIDTNLTNLKKELKQFIIPNKLKQLDIVNSQPYILSLYLNQTTHLTPPYVGGILNQEIDKFCEWTKNGLFYENFQKQYFDKTSKVLSRKEIKDIMFCIFYSKNSSYIKEKNIFKSIFPNINTLIIKEKIQKHNQFAIKMQQLESNICIDIICKELNNNNIKYYTIHDSWLVDDKDLNKTEEIINKCFNLKYNSSPKLKIENVN